MVCITHSENVSSPFLIPFLSFPGRSVVKNPPANARATGSIPGPGRLSGGGNGNRSNILAWKILCVIAKSQIRKSTQAHTCSHFPSAVPSWCERRAATQGPSSRGTRGGECCLAAPNNQAGCCISRSSASGFAFAHFQICDLPA